MFTGSIDTFWLFHIQSSACSIIFHVFVHIKGEISYTAGEKIFA